MDQIPKDENQNQQEQTSGNIFDNNQVSDAENSAYGQTQNFDTAESSQMVNNYTEGTRGADMPPPPFIEDKRKKYLVIAIGGVFLFILFIIGIILLKNRKSTDTSSKDIVLNYWGLWEEKDIIVPLLDEYKTKHPNITINYSKQEPKLYRERLKAAIERGEGPDLFRFHNTWVPMLQSVLSAVPETVYSADEYSRLFFPVMNTDLKSGTRYYGIPLEIDGLMLYYNEDILKGANVPVPVTWDDVQAAVPKLTVKEGGRIVTSTIALGTAENIEHFSDILGLMMLQNGVNLSRSAFSCSDPRKVDCAVEVLTFYRSFAEPPGNTWDELQDNSLVAFAGGKVAMIFAPSWQAFFIKSLAPNLNFKTARVPQLPCKSAPCPSIDWATYWVEGVSATSKYQAEAWEFLKYISSEDALKKMYEQQLNKRILFGEPYSRAELANTLKSNPYIAPIIEMAPTMKSFYLASRTYDGDTGINTLLINYLKDRINSLSQGVSPEAAMRTFEEGLQQIFKNFNISASAQ